MLDLALLLLGLAAIAWGTTLAVDNAIRIATHYQLSDLFIGFSLLAVGTDLPELMVSIDASLQNRLGGSDTSSLIVGNALGSCFALFGLGMGSAGLLGYLTMSRRYLWWHGAALLGGILVLTLTALDGNVTRLEGGLLVACFLAYFAWLIGEETALPREERTAAGNPRLAWLLLVFGLLVVVGSAELIVDAAVALAAAWGVSQAVIAICIIGVGTSMPEFVISVVAVRKSRHGMSVGNMIGSNVLNILLPVGLAALIHPVRFEAGLLRVDVPLLALLTLLVLAFFVRRRGLQKGEARILVAFYAGYILWKLLGTAL